VAAPDFYFVVNSTARHINDAYGKDALIAYWRALGREYYNQRVANWRTGGLPALASDWLEYFLEEPGADVRVSVEPATVQLDIQVCPAIKHLRDSQREIVPYFCEHCDHICGAMAEAANLKFDRTGGMGACIQTFSLTSEDAPTC
jgi:hypothetical protein